jgi:hypothetical protein
MQTQLLTFTLSAKFNKKAPPAQVEKALPKAFELKDIFFYSIMTESQSQTAE